jgi:hypothetical protein
MHFFNRDSQEQPFLVIGNPERVEPKAQRVSSLADPLLHYAIRFRIDPRKGNFKHRRPNGICSIADVASGAGDAHLNRGGYLPAFLTGWPSEINDSGFVFESASAARVSGTNREPIRGASMRVRLSTR